MAVRNEVRSLTGLRGLAALVVVLYHFSHVLTRGTARNPVGPGYLAVDLFFVLSGFLMTMIYASRFSGPISGGEWRRFLSKRFARVYPMYGLAISVAIGLAIFRIGNAPLAGASIASNFLLLQNTGLAKVYPPIGITPIGPSWSLSTEAVAYLAFPLLLRIGGRRERLSKDVGVALASLGALFMVTVLDRHGVRGPLDLQNARSLSPLARCFADYVLGISTWRITHGLQKAPRSAWAGTLAALVVAALWCVHGSDVLIVAAFAALISATYPQTDKAARVLGGRVAFFLGQASYSLYLIHIPSLILLDWIVPQVHVSHGLAVSLLLLAGFDIAVAYGLFRVFEGPAQDWLNKLFGGRRPPNTSEPAAP